MQKRERVLEEEEVGMSVMGREGGRRQEKLVGSCSQIQKHQREMSGAW